MTVMWQTLSVSKEAFSLLSTSKMAELLSGEIVINFVFDQEHISL